MSLRAPDGTGIKGGLTSYHAERMLRALSFVPQFDSISETATQFAVDVAVDHARLAARAALNGMYNGKRPFGGNK
jgi:hypothetical protein